MTIRWTPNALRDVDSLHSYIAADHPNAAVDVVSKIAEGITDLTRHPANGRKGRVAGTRELIVHPYVVAYRIDRQSIHVVAIIHGARRWPDSF
jgi:toxin ParE1/3/4